MRDLGAGFGTLIDQFGVLKALLLMLFPGCLAFCMIASEFALLQRTNVVTLSVCGIFKEVATILAGQVEFKDHPLTPVNFTGLAVTISSIAAYNYLKVRKMRQEARVEVVHHDANDWKRHDPPDSFVKDNEANNHADDSSASSSRVPEAEERLKTLRAQH